jgi:hypothetical protein
LTRKYVIDKSRKGNRVSCKESGGLIPPEYMYINDPKPMDNTLWHTLKASLIGATCRLASQRTVAAAVIVPPQKHPNTIPAAMCMTNDVEPTPPALSLVLLCSRRKATMAKAKKASGFGGK